MQMPESYSITVPLSAQELQALYEISNAVAREPDIEKALELIVKLTRPVLIFDNFVVYVNGSDGMQPTFARIIGRGRAAEADLAWGESIASNVINTGRLEMVEERLENWEQNRLNLRFLLALPLHGGEDIHGAVVFGRFGGPPFSQDQVRLSEFVATHVGQLLVRQQLVGRIAVLEAERRLQTIQENFIAMVSHELRSPLGFIKGYTTTLLRQDISWDENTRYEFLKIIDEEAERLRGLIDNLLDSSRLQSGSMKMQLQQTPMDELIKEIFNRIKRISPPLDIQLHIKQPFTTWVDPIRFTQVIDNLITNAVKYAENSQIAIQVDVVENHPLTSQKAGYISVRDSGPGMEPEHVEHVFKRFYRVPGTSSKYGAGLGLFICREIMHAHGGEIGCESRLGQGTTFHLYLPLRGNTDMPSNNTEPQL
jgi:signal transduction histidine kinase